MNYTQKRRIHTQNTPKTRSSETTTTRLHFFILSSSIPRIWVFLRAVKTVDNCPRREIVARAQIWVSQRSYVDSNHPHKKHRLARRFSQMGYLEPKWLRYLYVIGVWPTTILIRQKNGKRKKGQSALIKQCRLALIELVETSKTTWKGRTNRRNVGKTSADRVTKNTLILTIPRCN